MTDYPESWALENDVYDNLIEFVKDDAIEPECQAINVRVFRNHMRNVFVAISLAPIETGPTWVLSATRYVFEHSRADPFPPGNVMDYNSSTPPASGAS